MATFAYQAMNSQGKTQKGTVEAASAEEAAQRIKAQGYFPTEVREQKVQSSAVAGAPAKLKRKRRGGGLSFGGVSKKHLTLFTRQMSTLQDAGLPLLRSLQILEEQQKPGKLKNVLGDLAEDVEGGASLSDGMSKHPSAFDRLYCKMVAAGEVGGVLDVILQRLADFMEKTQRLKRQVRGAMIYPIAVVIVAMGIMAFIMLFIIPKFEEIFEDFGVKLPALTRWLIDTSRWTAGTLPGQQFPGIVIILAAPILIMVFWKLLRKTRPGKAVTDYGLFYTPLFGSIIRMSSVARFTRTLGTLISAGVPILEAVLITRDTSGNYVYERALERVHDSIREGESFGPPLRESKVCDSIVVNMIEVGEETGELDTMLMKVADNYDEEVEVKVSSMTKLIEPMMVVVIGGMVGTIVVAMFLPMVEMINSLNKGAGG